MILDLNNQDIKNSETSSLENLNLSEEVIAILRYFFFYYYLVTCWYRYDHFELLPYLYFTFLFDNLSRTKFRTSFVEWNNLENVAIVYDDW